MLKRKKLSRKVLAEIPSPLVKLENLTRRLKANIVYTKRDDLLGRLLGGNKLRKLEYIIPLAQDADADTLITTGSFESNHACLTAFVANMLGMKPVLVLMGPKERRELTFNEMMLRRLNTEVRNIYFDEDDRDSLSQRVSNCVDQLTDQLKKKGCKPFFVPPAGCCLEGTYAFVEAFNELHDQMLLLGHHSYDIVLAVGTGSTYSGLWCGAKCSGTDINVIGISIARPNPRCIDETLKAAQRVCNYLGIPAPAINHVQIYDQYIGGGYAEKTALSQKAINLALQSEGLLLDHTYTGKALGGLMDLLEKRKLGDKPIVFWHTGGVSGAIDALINS